MINNHLALFVPESQPMNQMDVDQKKMVKMFVYQHPQTWIEYIKGELVLVHDQEHDLVLKIRLLSTTNLSQIQALDFLPFHFQSDLEGPYLNIKEEIISTVEKSDENVLYIKLKICNIVIALSFLNKPYCNTCLQQILLDIQADQDQFSWNQKFLPFLVNQTLDWTFNRLVFTDKDKISQFCAFVKRSIKSKNIDFSKQTIQIDESLFYQMNAYFKIAKNLSLYFDKDILSYVTEIQQLFECLLICYSFNPFGNVHYNYVSAFQNALKINNHLDIQNDQIIQSYISSIRAKFLKDVALCTFIQISTQGALSQSINQNYTKILTIVTESDMVFSELVKLSNQNSEHFIYIFIELWQIFKAVLQDIDTKSMKNKFYEKWIQFKLFEIVLSVFHNFVKQKQGKIIEVNPRIWQKFTQSMNPMMSYNWSNAEDIIIFHSQKQQNMQKDLMTSLIRVIKECDLNTKVIVLDFVKSQIQVSQNRKVIKQKNLSYLFNKFVIESFKHFGHQEFIEKFLQFIIGIYEAQPIRTRQIIIQQNLFQILKQFEDNKYVFIMVIKLLKKFVESTQNKDIFCYLQNRNYFASLRQKYAMYQHSKNIINSLFLNLFKAVENSTSGQGKKYVYSIFFPQQSMEQVKQDIQKVQKEYLSQNENELKYKRPLQIMEGIQNELI